MTAATQWTIKLHVNRAPARGLTPGGRLKAGKILWPPTLNSRLHWRAKHSRNKQWLELAAVAIRQAEIPPCERVRISATIYRKRHGDPDNDLAMIKPFLDALSRCGVIRDDTRRYLEIGPILEARGEPAIELTVERLA